MSKQSEAKSKQNYRKKLNKCANCAHFSFEVAKTEYGFLERKNKRCGVGGFAVMENSVCDIWEAKGE